jgi:threonine aldolase
MNQSRGFASDNNAGAHPAVLESVAAANVGHAPAYGADRWTTRAKELLQREFGNGAAAYFVYGGTGANVVALSALLAPWQGVICPAGAHINVDECGAPERFTGCKLLPVTTRDGKLRPADLAPALAKLGDQHSVQPAVVSISQATELGTVYTAEEVRQLADAAHASRLRLHVDGARLANAAVSLGTSLAALTAEAGVDILSFGGTKNGLLGAEAIVCFGGNGPELQFLRKQAAQLPSKMRFLSAQFIALLESGLWQRNASNANAMARRLAAGLTRYPRIRISQPVEANAVFAELPPDRIPGLQARYPFYVWNEATAEVRWMCSWDTTEADVDAFLAVIGEVVR